MKVLLLTCNTGEGHNSCAEALKEAFAQEGTVCDCVDVLDFLSPQISALVSHGHTAIYRHFPHAYSVCYDMTRDHPIFGRYSMVRLFLASGVAKLAQMIVDGGYDRLICAHVFAGLMADQLRRKTDIDIPACLLATDYTCSSGTEQCHPDVFFIPQPALAYAFVSKGIPPEKLIPSGIPVKRACMTRTDKAQAKAALGLPADRRIVLLMGGSMGCGNLAERAKHLAEHLPNDTTVVVLCGRNKSLLEQLAPLRSEKLLPVGFTKDAPLYMDSAELMITKPGGLTITEAAHKGLPMIFFNVVGSYEQDNLDFFLKRGWAEAYGSQETITQRTIELLNDPRVLEQKSQRLQGEFHTEPAQSIVRWTHYGETTSTYEGKVQHALSYQ